MAVRRLGSGIWFGSFKRESSGTPYGLKGHKSPLFESQLSSLIDDRLHRILCIGEAFVVPFTLTTL